MESSPRPMRSPEQAGNCPICKRPYRPENMVECTGCQLWCCYECVGVTDEVCTDDSWRCPMCVKMKMRMEMRQEILAERAAAEAAAKSGEPSPIYVLGSGGTGGGAAASANGLGQGVRKKEMNQEEQMIEDQNFTLGQPLSDFLLQLEDYTPTIPDAVTSYYLRSSGFDPKDPRLVRLISIAAQKFISDIANDALQHCKMRSTNTSSHSSSKSKQGHKDKDRRYCLTMDDLTPALAEFGITIKKPHYYV